jgi:hypothetical protein
MVGRDPAGPIRATQKLDERLRVDTDEMGAMNHQCCWLQ